jgi:hypothetical protein
MRGSFGIAQEGGTDMACGERLVANEPQRDGASELRVPGAVDLAEGALAEALEQVVMGDGSQWAVQRFAGRDGRSSTRLGRLLAGCAIRSTTTCATSSGASFQSSAGPLGDVPRANPVATEPGMT